MPTLYDLFWSSGPPVARKAAAARSRRGGSIVVPTRKPAAILYPAFLTPGLYFPDDPQLGGFFELLIATPDNAPLTVDDVNDRLVVTRGLGWRRGARLTPLFPSPHDKIHVDTTVPDSNGILETHTQFRGVPHQLWRKHLSGQFAEGKATFWKVRVHASALDAAPKAEMLPGSSTPDPMDAAIAALFVARNGKNFQRALTFHTAGHDVLPEAQDLDKPILAHHPLAVYKKHQGALGTVAHVSDLHINMRQDLFAQSNAQVVEDPDSTDISPEIGSLVHRYSRSVAGIFAAIPRATDAVCIGGDLVDHIRNATPRPFFGALPFEDFPVNAAAVWDRVELDKSSYNTRYQAGPDFIAAFTIFRDVCNDRQMPFFGISGNHDAYVDGYGISPRPANNRSVRLLANEGIAADHNLTLFEAILMFGKTYDEYGGYGDVRGGADTLLKSHTSNFHKEWFDWFHTVFTPFSDFVIRMPHQRLVGLGWGESEHMLSKTDDGQGRGHLPRATDAFKASQQSLLTAGLDAGRRTLLMTHFTFASFKGEIPELQTNGKEPTGSLKLDGGFTDFDHGTFVNDRRTVYRTLVDRAGALSVVLTGHSHRKALYLLDADSGGARAGMVGLADGGVTREWLASTGGTPVVLSDSAGPMPRSNVTGEFGSWGSDATAGSLLRFDDEGGLIGINVLKGQNSPKPRAAVALEYWHYQEDVGVWDGAILEFNAVMRPDPANRSGPNPPKFWITLKSRWRDLGLRVVDVAFLGRRAVATGAPAQPGWIRVIAHATGEQAADVGRMVQRNGVDIVPRYPLWQISEDDRAALADWMRLGTSSDRFLALRFSPDDTKSPGISTRYDWASWWTFESVARLDSSWPDYAERWIVKPTAGGWFSDDTNHGRPVVDQPDFRHRIEIAPNKYDVITSSAMRKRR